MKGKYNGKEQPGNRMASQHKAEAAPIADAHCECMDADERCNTNQVRPSIFD